MIQVVAETSQKGLQLMQSEGSLFCSSSGKSHGDTKCKQEESEDFSEVLLAAVHFRPRKPPVSFTASLLFMSLWLENEAQQ